MRPHWRPQEMQEDLHPLQWLDWGYPSIASSLAKGRSSGRLLSPLCFPSTSVCEGVCEIPSHDAMLHLRSIYVQTSTSSTDRHNRPQHTISRTLGCNFWHELLRILDRRLQAFWMQWEVPEPAPLPV